MAKEFEIIRLGGEDADAVTYTVVASNYADAENRINAYLAGDSTGGVLAVERWKYIEEYPQYMVSTKGRVYSFRDYSFRETPVGKRGYPVVSFLKNGIMQLRTVHTLLAKAFIPNPYNKPEINHIDGDKTNCTVENLEWVTRKENDEHARNTGLLFSNGDKAVKQKTLDGRFIQRFKSCAEASRITGISRANIASVARGNTKQKTAGGYLWEYARK